MTTDEIIEAGSVTTLEEWKRMPRCNNNHGNIIDDPRQHHPICRSVHHFFLKVNRYQKGTLTIQQTLGRDWK